MSAQITLGSDHLLSIINEELDNRELHEHVSINYLQEKYKCCGYTSDQEYTNKIMDFEPFNDIDLQLLNSNDFSKSNQSEIN